MRKKLPKSINLIETINTPGDTFTIFYDWTFTIGKYLLIFVQIIVIVVFFVRLSVDKVNNDLTRDINNQVELLLQAEVRENEGRYRKWQVFLDDLDRLDRAQVKNSRNIVSVLDSIPEEITLDSFSFNSGRIMSSFEAESFDSIKSYEAFLERSPEYNNIRISLEKIDDENYDFSVNYIIREDTDE